MIGRPVQFPSNRGTAHVSHTLPKRGSVRSHATMYQASQQIKMDLQSNLSMPWQNDGASQCCIIPMTKSRNY